MTKNHEKQKAVYIFCYADYASGGPEALHQLRYYMEQQGIDAWIVYLDRRTADVSITERYRKYFPKEEKYIGEGDYVDCAEHLIIMPEALTYRLFRYKKSQMAIWWLGVAAFDGRRMYLEDYAYSGQLEKLLCKVKYRLENGKRAVKTWYLYHGKKVRNYCGSQYAYEFVTGKHQKAELLVEPISKEFLDAGGIFCFADDMLNRECKVLYNPKRKSALMEQLLQRGAFTYVPISGYTPDGLIELYRKNRLYIDFGGFPGPERLPKETVYNGCTLLVGKRNAAVNDFDVAIPEKYKLVNPTADQAEKMIGDMLEHYREQFDDFEFFRNKIDGLEAGFMEAIKKLFSDYILTQG